MTVHELWGDVPDLPEHEAVPLDEDTGPALRGMSMADMLAAWEARPDTTAITTGIASLDRATGGGLPTGQVSTLLGYSGTGKSELARQIGRAAERAGHPVVHVDVELGPARLVLRRLAQDSQIASRRLADRGATYTADELRRIDAAKRGAAESTVRYICDGGLAPLGQLARCITDEAAAAGEGPALVIIDSLQRISAQAEGLTIRDQVTRAMHWLEHLAHTSGHALLVVCEMSRAKEGGIPRPAEVKTSGAESRAIEYVSDLMIGLHALGEVTSQEAGDATDTWERAVAVIVAKARDGREGVLPDVLVYRGPCWEMDVRPAPQDTSHEELDERILEALSDGETWTTDDLRRKTRCRKTTLRQRLAALQAEDVIEHVREGKRPRGWRIPPDGRGPAPGTACRSGGVGPHGSASAVGGSNG